MSTQRINALPDGTVSHTGTARIAFEDSNDASNTTKFLNVTSLGNEFLPLTGGTMTGDIDMNINDINEIGTLLFKNIGTGANPSLFSNTDGGRELSLNGDFLVLTDGKLGFGNNFFQETALGTEVTFSTATKFIINFPTSAFFEFKSTLDTGTISSLSVFGETGVGSPVEYSDIDTVIVNNDNTLFSGGINFQTAVKGATEVNIVGININDQKELFIYDNIRFNNLGTGADPILSASSVDKELTLDGNLIFANQTDKLKFPDGSDISSAGDILSLFTPDTIQFESPASQPFGLIVQFVNTTVNTVGTFAALDFAARDSSNAFALYAGMIAEIVDPANGFETGAWRFVVTVDNVIDQPMLGMNIDDDLAVKIFNSLRLENSTDSTLDSFIESNNGSGQQLAVWKGSMQMDFTKQAELAQIGTITYQGFHTAPIAPNTTITRHEYFDRNSLSQNRQYARIDAMVEDDTAAAEEGSYLIQARSAGSLASFIDINSGGNGFTAFTKPINLAGNEIDNIKFTDFDVIADPGNPDTSHGRVYAKVIDANNDGLFIRIKKNNVFTEVQIA